MSGIILGSGEFDFYDDDYLEDMRTGCLFNAPPARKVTDDGEVGDSFIGEGSMSGGSGSGGGGGSMSGGGSGSGGAESDNVSEPASALTLTVTPKTVGFDLSKDLGMRVSP